jgi:protease-4
VWLVGFYGETPYLRGALDKLGILPDIERCGDYKTGPEPLTRTGPSEESMEMMDWLLDGIYEGLVDMIAEGRGLSPEKVRSLINNGPYTAEDALKAGLIDSVKHRQDFIADLKERYGKSVKVVTDYAKEDGTLPEDPFALFSLLMRMLNPSPKTYTTPSVGVVYVDGLIQTGAQEVTPFGVASGAFSTTIRKALDKATEDRSVKAVVLRVDSPGGSALASEIILNATKRAARKKPLIVSMGNVAGSGGYYVSCGAETIFADRNTFTASIGVFSGKLVTTEGWNRLGVNWHAVQRGEMAGLFSSAAPFSDEERAKVRQHMNRFYEWFKDHVTEGRGDRLTRPIDELAGGRVYTGAQALGLGLVDKIGGLDDAIKFAAKRAGLAEYEVRVIPEPPNILELILSSAKKEDEFARVVRPKALSLDEIPPFSALLPALARVDPLRARVIRQQLICIELIEKEGAVMMMPAGLVLGR